VELPQIPSYSNFNFDRLMPQFEMPHEPIELQDITEIYGLKESIDYWFIT
jgi:hypothetical protein